MYTCSGCGAAAKLVEGQLSRECQCDAAVIANMSASCSGKGVIRQSK